MAFSSFFAVTSSIRGFATAARTAAGVRVFPRRSITISSCRKTSVQQQQDQESPNASSANDGAFTQCMNPDIVGIVDKIEKMTILEVAELTSLLKDRLKITDISMPVASSAAGFAQSDTDGSASNEENAEPKKLLKTEFKVVIKEFASTSKAKLIKEIKLLNPSMSLVEAKKQVEGLPCLVRDNLSKEEAEALKNQLEGAGAVISLE